VATFGGPKGQSISNNRELAQLVHMATAVRDAESAPGRRPRRSWEDEILSKIDDPHVRSQVQIVLVERRSLIGEVNTLKDNFKRLKALEGLTPVLATAEIETLEQLADLVRKHEPLDGGNAFTDEERAACRDFLGKAVKTEGWVLDEASGEIQSKMTKRPVARRGVLSALRKVIGAEAPGTAPVLPTP
jgi:hypothetical protein